jgi:oligoendopeptidase F
MPFGDAAVVPFDEARRIVLDAYAGFSPTMASLAGEALDKKRVDAPHVANKEGGAYNYSAIIPGRPPMSFTFLNYLGSNRDVMTLAHELGHGVHGVLAGEAQGPLMFQAPRAYAETASVFGEMMTFDALKSQLLARGDKKALLALVMGKLDDMMNTQIRQISFSNFERRLHAAGRRLSPEEISAVWVEVTKEMYGAEGEVFTYEHAGRLWAYVSHFFRPFYVYAYAVGDLFTQSLYARRASYGERFEPLYLDLLRAGGTKDAAGLLKPFGLDPGAPSFWAEGLRAGMQALLEEAERLSAEMGVAVR